VTDPVLGVSWLQVCVVLVLWVALQVAVLLSQDIFGPQYMIPARFLPPKYNYYRPIPQSLRSRESSGEDSGAVEMTGQSVTQCHARSMHASKGTTSRLLGPLGAHFGL
jgi:hypothetical protein